MTVSGFPQVISDLQLIFEQAYPEVVKGLQEAGEDIATDAQARAPVKTGRLKASIRSTPLPNGAVVTAGGGPVDYAGFQEVGTNRMAGRAYMASAVSDWLDRVDSLVHARLPA